MNRQLALAALVASGIATSPALARADQGELVIRIPKPRLAVGASYMRVSGDTGSEATGVALEGRLVFGRLALVGELGKDEFESEDRIDRRIGGSLHWRFSPGSLSPYVRAGAGIIRTDTMSGLLVYDDLFGELGLGIEKRLGPRISLTAGVTAGRRETWRWIEQDVILLAGLIYLPQDERFVRAHGGILISF